MGALENNFLSETGLVAALLLTMKHEGNGMSNLGLQTLGRISADPLMEQFVTLFKYIGEVVTGDFSLVEAEQKMASAVTGFLKQVRALEEGPQKYYLLSKKWTYHSSNKKDNLVWWGPDGNGYTQDLSKAGVYTADQIHADYWKPDSTQIPVKKELADALYTPHHILHESSNLEALGVDVKRWFN